MPGKQKLKNIFINFRVDNGKQMAAAIAEEGHLSNRANELLKILLAKT